MNENGEMKDLREKMKASVLCKDTSGCDKQERMVTWPLFVDKRPPKNFQLEIRYESVRTQSHRECIGTTGIYTQNSKAVK